MKKIVDVPSSEAGLEALLGKRVTLFCVNYIYTGDLVGVNDAYVQLANPAIVYETGAFNTTDWKDAQALPHDVNVMLHAVESFGILK